MILGEKSWGRGPKNRAQRPGGWARKCHGEEGGEEEREERSIEGFGRNLRGTVAKTEVA